MSMSSQDNKRKEALRKNIEASIDRAEQIRKQELLNRRMEIAREGAKHNANGRIAEAIKNFHLYLKLLEDWKQVQKGQLAPHHFDKVIDLPEIIIISAVYWDLAKIYDMSKDPQVVQQVSQYLDKYVLFSKGFGHESLCAESMRKYISKSKPRHTALFKQHYKRYGRSECFVVSSLMDQTEEETLVVFRGFRDQILLKYKLGQLFIRFYYFAGPLLSAVLDRSPNHVRKTAGRLLDRTARSLKLRL